MNDRECLLIAYGALTASGNHAIASVIGDHLFSDKPSNAITPPHKLYAEPQSLAEFQINESWEAQTRPAPIAQPGPTEEKPATPGDYRLKRAGLGEVGSKLNELHRPALRKKLNKYENALAQGAPMHPHALEDERTNNYSPG